MANTHEVFNQPAPLAGYNLFEGNRPMRDALALHAPGLATTGLSQLGATLGTADMQTHARLANSHAPVLHTHDRFGRRIDEVEFHPSYHALMGAAVGAGLHGAPWGSPHPNPPPEGEGTTAPPPALGEGRGGGKRDSQAETAPSGGSAVHAVTSVGAHRFGAGPPQAETAPSGGSAVHAVTSVGAHLQRAAGFMLFTELEPSTLCPISMSYAVMPALCSHAAIYADWGPGLSGRVYDPALKRWSDKAGLTMGMGMTEKQGGSDVRANTTRAEPDGNDRWGERYLITGHKWFFSAPMCDAFLVLAQTKSGLSCLFVPRVLPDDTRNAIRIQRLKDKLGNKANASSEVEFESATGWLVGEEGRGIAQILEMGTMTRLDCALGSSGLMRQALSLALNHCSQRQAFGKPLIAQPLMRNVLADLALESEAATVLALRLAHAFDRPDDAHEKVMARLLTPVAKFWICKRGSHFAQEAMECLGGNGYVEEGGAGVMARIYREMPLNSIWEGAGNIMALDLLRALRKADSAAALVHELAPARGAHAALDRLAAALPTRVEQMVTELEARRLAQDVALALQAALLHRSAPAPVFDAFCDSRIAGNWGQTFGTLPGGADFDSIISRALPVQDH